MMRSRRILWFVATLSLDRLDDDRTTTIGIVHQRFFYLLDRLFLKPGGNSKILLEWKRDLRVENARPVVIFREALVLVWIRRVRQG